MGYSRAVRLGVLKKVLPLDAQSIVEESKETGINDQNATTTKYLPQFSCRG